MNKEKKINRFTDLLKFLMEHERYQDDWWLKSYISEPNQDLSKKVIRINNLLSNLDDDSWDIFRKKLIEKFPNENPNRGKDVFFNTLNEAYGYQYLLNKEFIDVKFIPENDKHATSDLKYSFENVIYDCEVKSINISEKQIKIYECEDLIDSYQLYSNLSDNFFGKLTSTIEQAKSQITTNGLIIIILSFDDFTHRYINAYKESINEWFDVEGKELRLCILVDSSDLKEPLIERNIEMITTRKIN